MDTTIDAVTCFVSVEGEGAPLAGKGATGQNDSHVSSALDDELVLTAFNPEDYEYNMFLQFVDPSVEKEYLLNAKFKVRQPFGSKSTVGEICFPFEIYYLTTMLQIGRLCIPALSSCIWFLTQAAIQ